MLSLLFSWMSLAFAGPLVGTWELDAVASESVDALMEAHGAPWWERQLAKKTAVTQIITEPDAQTVQLAIRSTFKSMDETLVLDDQPRRQTTPEGREVTVRHRRDPDGAAITETALVLEDGRPATLTVHRFVVGDTLTQRLTLTIEGQAPISAARVFRRVTGG